MMAVPLVLWSLVFFVSCLIAWGRKFTLARAAAVSALPATGIVVLLRVSALAFVLVQSRAA